MTLHLSRRILLASLGALAVVPARAADTLELRAPNGRRIAISQWRARRPRGTILFSHGALSAPWKYTALIEPWVADGWDVWAPLHVDSTDHPDTKSFPGLTSWPARLEDMRVLADHVDARRYVAAGHSYGGLVALVLGGASPAPSDGLPRPLRDRRARAVVAFSPPGPGMGLIDAAGYATLAVPALIETGTADLPPTGPGAPPPATDAWRAHLAAYKAGTPVAPRYALVLDGADHYFGNLICRPERAVPSQRVQLDTAIARSLSFMRGHRLDGAVRSSRVSGPGLYRR